MVALSTLVGAEGGGGGLPIEFYFRTSQTWTCPMELDGKTAIFRQWASAGGGACVRSSTGRASGGASGGHGLTFLKLKGGEDYVMTLAAGAVGRIGSEGATLNGNDGNTTRLQGPDGLDVLCTGGQGGRSDGTSATPGTCTGASFNFSGGPSGACSTTGTATGGAAPAYGADGYASPAQAVSNQAGPASSIASSNYLDSITTPYGEIARGHSTVGGATANGAIDPDAGAFGATGGCLNQNTAGHTNGLGSGDGGLGGSGGTMNRYTGSANYHAGSTGPGLIILTIGV